MGDAKVDGERTGSGKSGESNLRGKELNGAERRDAPTLYNDALDLEDDSSPLTGVNGRDDSIKPR
jgi:hypothetical protein